MVPNVDLAFASVEHIMRDVNYGWLRYVHANGASIFFIVVSSISLGVSIMGVICTQEQHYGYQG